MRGEAGHETLESSLEICGLLACTISSIAVSVRVLGVNVTFLNPFAMAKRARQELSRFDKIWLAKCKKQNGYTHQQCREAYWKEFKREPDKWPLPNSTLSGFLCSQHIDEWAAQDLSSCSERAFRRREAKYPKLEEALYMWAIQNSTRGIVSDALALEKARELGPKLGISGFQYSKGWLSNWKKRYGVKLQRLHEEIEAGVRGMKQMHHDLCRALAAHAECGPCNHDQNTSPPELQASEDPASKAPALTSLAGAQAHINDLMDFFESGFERLSGNEKLQLSGHLNEMLSRFMHVQEGGMKKASV
jgi:hypothetical protein